MAGYPYREDKVEKTVIEGQINAFTLPQVNVVPAPGFVPGDLDHVGRGVETVGLVPPFREVEDEPSGATPDLETAAMRRQVVETELVQFKGIPTPTVGVFEPAVEVLRKLPALFVPGLGSRP